MNMLKFPINTQRASRNTIDKLIEMGILVRTRDGFRILEEAPATDRKSEQGQIAYEG